MSEENDDVDIDQASSIEDLLSLPRPRAARYELAVLGGHEDDLAIAAGYIRLGEIAARHWIEYGPDDGLPVPILYNYRHGIELTLKWLIRLSARCLERDGHTEEEYTREYLDKKLRTHKIKDLADRLDRQMRLLQIDSPSNQIDQASRQLLDWLNDEDESGETFRYSVVGSGKTSRPARPKQVTINFYELVNELHQLANLLYAGYSGFLDAFEQNQVDYYDDYPREG